MFRNMMQRRGASYPNPKDKDDDDENKKKQEEDKPPPIIHNYFIGEDAYRHFINTAEQEERAQTEQQEQDTQTEQRGEDVRNDSPPPPEPPNFQARIRFTSPARGTDDDNIVSQADGTTNEQVPSMREDQGHTAFRHRKEPAFGVRDKHEPGYSQLSQNERLSSSPGSFKESGARTPKEQGSGNQETTVKPNYDEKVPPYREETVSARRENDKQSGDMPVSSNETRGQTNVVPPQPRVRVPTEKKPEVVEEPEFNDERTPPPTDDG